MKTVRDVLSEKGSNVWTAWPEETVYAALERMAERDIGALLVCEDETPVGIFSERDYARQVILKGKASRDTPVREVMTTRLVCVDPDRPIEECMALMTAHHARHLPVLEEGRVVGLLSIGDAVKAAISEKQFLIDQLEQYIQQG